MLRRIPVFRLADATVKVTISPELDIDPEFDDPEAVASIERRLVDSDPHAWCVVTVSVSWRGFTGYDRISAVTFSENTLTSEILAFVNDYDMVATAVDGLAAALAQHEWKARFPTARQSKALRVANSQPVQYGPLNIRG